MLSGFLILGCQSHNIKIKEHSFIIQMTIDSALKRDSGLNTKDFWIDFSRVQYFDEYAINDFLKQHSNFTEINGDSLLKTDSTWVRFEYLTRMLIIFKKVEIKGDSIIISLDKIKSSDGADGIEIIIKKTIKDFKVVRSNIKWIG
jgi:hypothetical protein